MISTLNLFLLMKCNLNCYFCMSSSGPHRNEKMPLDLVLKIADEVKEWPFLFNVDYPVIRLTGGEPLLYKELGNTLKAFSFSPKIEIATNGTLLTKRHLSTISKHNVAINLSIYTNRNGAPVLSNDRIRKILQSGIPTALILTLTTHNVIFLEGLLDSLEMIGAKIIVINSVKPSYKATLNEYYSYALTPKEILKIHKILIKRKDRGVIYVFGKQNNIGSNDIEPVNSIECNCDYKQLSILSDGGVVPCSSLIENLIGNVYESSIISLYEKCHRCFQLQPHACYKIT